jgi:hypothetical protein
VAQVQQQLPVRELLVVVLHQHGGQRGFADPGRAGEYDDPGQAGGAGTGQQLLDCGNVGVAVDERRRPRRELRGNGSALLACDDAAVDGAHLHHNRPGCAIERGGVGRGHA